jgi:hypothetical protein
MRGQSGSGALRVAAQACRQCTHRSSQVEEGFFLCSVSSCASSNVLSCVSRGGSAHEQENPKVRGGVGVANQSGSIIFSHKSTTSSSSYSSSIARARPQHFKQAPGPPSSLFDPCMPEHHRRGNVDYRSHGSP